MNKIYKRTTSLKQGLLALALALFSGQIYSQTTYTFNYTGATQSVAVLAGNYSIQCWGGNGGNAREKSAVERDYRKIKVSST